MGMSDEFITERFEYHNASHQLFLFLCKHPIIKIGRKVNTNQDEQNNVDLMKNAETLLLKYT